MLPRQTVNGLLCFTYWHDAFLIHNPITGESSPWIETKRTVSTRNSSIGFGFDPRSDEHKVIWISSDKSGSDQVVKVFTVGKKSWRKIDAIPITFTVIPIPGFVIDPKIYKWSQTVELTEIDGRIAVLDWVSELEISLWTFHEDADGAIKWTEEVIHMPPHWNGKDDLSIEALTGTNLIFLLSENSDSIFYYNRKTQARQIVYHCMTWKG
ncbi:hypothetical protein MKX03_026203 [Papaver bracteatum]|nr:hypothetical protein MKX03_026203 [Papaver bracteatum]